MYVNTYLDTIFEMLCKFLELNLPGNVYKQFQINFLDSRLKEGH